MGILPDTPEQPATRFGRLWDRVVARPVRDANAESRTFMASPASRRADRKVLVVLLTTALVLTIQNYLNRPGSLEAMVWDLRRAGWDALADTVAESVPRLMHDQFAELLAWSAARFVGWLLVPVVIIRFVFRERVRDYGMKLQGMTQGFWLYVGMLAVVLPCVVAVSRRPSFLAAYPYYRLGPDESMWPYLYAWEAIHLCQFFALEFFFRGFLVHGTRHRFGSYSVMIMMVPYCMIHFGKPLPETLGSIIAGLVLGLMSLKTRSIWMGTALHGTVALSMDLLSLAHQGRL